MPDPQETKEEADEFYQTDTGLIDPFNVGDESQEGKRSRVATPLGFAIVESQTAKHKAAILPSSPNEPFVRVLPRSLNDTETTPLVENWLNWRLELAQYRRKIEMSLRHFNTYGIAVAYPFYDIRVKKRKLRLPIDHIDPATGELIRLGLGPPQEVEQQVFRGPNFEVDGIENFFPDPGARTFDSDNMRWVVRRKFVPYEKLKVIVESNPEMFNQKVFKMLEPQNTSTTSDDPFVSEVSRYHIYPFDQTTNAQEGMVEIWQYLSADRIIWTANQDYPIMDIEDPYWLNEIPCIVGTRLPMLGYPWGKGSIEPIERIVAHIVSNRNMRLDAQRLGIQPMWITLKNAVPNPEQLYSTEPNRIIETLQRNALEQVKIQDTTSGSFAEEDILRQDIDLSSNSFGFSSGNIPANIRSATQQLSLMEMVAERDQMDIEAFDTSFVAPLARWFVALGQMFTTRDEIIRLDEEEGHKFPVISPQDLLGEFDYKVAGAARVIPKAVEAQQKQAFANSILPVLQNPVGVPDQYIKIMASIAKDQGYHDIWKILKDTAKMLRIMRFLQGGLMGDPNGQAGAGLARQLVQGGNGAQGAGTSVDNTSLDLESLSRSIGQEAGPDDFDVI
ncbi:MAG TPA: hypothetical protein ENI23_09445 [bacterium]|nr:hypothetical protein [bacterium]